jgi:hypothetical protein
VFLIIGGDYLTRIDKLLCSIISKVIVSILYTCVSHIIVLDKLLGRVIFAQLQIGIYIKQKWSHNISNYCTSNHYYFIEKSICHQIILKRNKQKVSEIY